MTTEKLNGTTPDPLLGKMWALEDKMLGEAWANGILDEILPEFKEISARNLKNAIIFGTSGEISQEDYKNLVLNHPPLNV